MIISEVIKSYEKDGYEVRVFLETIRKEYFGVKLRPILLPDEKDYKTYTIDYAA